MKYIYSPFLIEDLYQKSKKWISNDIHIVIISNILNEEDIDLVNEKTANDKDFKQSDTEIELHESVEKLNHPQE